MAYYTTGYVGSNDVMNQLYQAVRGALTAAGWTEHDILLDNPGVGRDIVFRSAPIDATADNRCFFRWTYGGSGIGNRIYTDWALATHIGTKVCGTNPTNALLINVPSTKYFIRANEYAVSYTIRTPESTWGYYSGYAGFVRRDLSSAKNGLTKTTSSYAVGTSTMNVASDMTSKLLPGQKVVIYNQGHVQTANFSNSELLTIQSIASGSITFTAPSTQAYDSGAVIGWNPYPVCSVYGSGAQQGPSSGYTCLNLDGTYTGISLQPLQIDVVGLGTDYDKFSFEYPGGLYCVRTTTSTKAGTIGYLYHWEAIAQVANMENVANEDVMSDGTNSFIVLGRSGSVAGMVGPI
jgi:hypothetical protein